MALSKLDQDDLRGAFYDDEAAEVYYALVTGTFALRDKGYLRTARRIADAVRDAARRADPALVKRYPQPDGY